jgi:multidrug efflux pump subunit AcrB
MIMAKFFIDNYKFTIVLMLGLTLYGCMGAIGLNSETFPSVDIGSVVVTTNYPGASAEDMESKVTKPIEDEIRGVRGLKEVKSVSQEGLSRIVTVVDIDNYDVEEVVADVQRAVDRTPNLPVDLPNPPNFFEVKSEEFPVIEVAVIGSNEGRVRDEIAFELSEELEDNKKISSINLTGYRERQFNILIDKQKMQALHVSIEEVATKIRAQNINIPGGNLESGSQLKKVKLEGKMESDEALSQLVIRSNFSGEKVLLGDIATIEDGQEDAETLAKYEGQPATIVTIAKKGGADIITLAGEVREVLEVFQEKYEDQVKFVIFNDEGRRVGNRIDILTSNGQAGLVLVVILLLVFLPGRIGLMSSISLPLAVLAVFGYMSSVEMTLNTINILALVISLGMLVDNAVVISENVARLMDQGMAARDAAIKTIASLWLPITATAFTTIAAFLPMLVTQGVIGQFIRGIPILVTAALIFSLGESFFLLPVRLLIARKKTAQEVANHKEDWFTTNAIKPFGNFVEWLVNHRYLASVLFTGLIAGSIYMIGFVNKFILFPASQTEIYTIRLEMPEGTRIEKTDEMLEVLLGKLRQTLGDEALHVAGKVGISEQDFGDPKSKRGENVGIAFVFMTEEAKNSRVTNDVLKQLRTIEIEGVKDLSFSAAINGPPIGDPVTAVFRSNNVDNLDTVTGVVMNKLRETEGVFDVQLDDVFGADEKSVEFDQVKAGRLGLDFQSVGFAVRMAVAGEILEEVNIDNKDVNYFIRFKEGGRQTLEDLKSIKISDRRGNLIPLSEVATIKEQKASPQIKRFDFKRAKTVTANIDDDIITSVKANAIVGKTFEGIKDQYKDVSLKFGGEGERTQESFQSLMQALVLSLIGIFALLVFLFKSYIRPVIILTTIPLGLVGVAIAFWVHQRPISFLALIGVIGLGGIIVNSGIVLISFIEQLREEQPERDLTSVLKEAAALRLRAVVVTSLTTVSGLLPTAYGIGGADEFIIPMTLAMAWGLTSGTVLALLWVPCAYAITEDLTAFLSSLWPRTFSLTQASQAHLETAVKYDGGS